MTGLPIDLPIGMLSQYGSQAGAPADATGLYVLFGGANDLLAAASLPTQMARNAAIQTAVTNIGTIASGLYAQGARYFLIPNLPNIGLSPLALGQGAAASALLSAETQAFNLLLAQQLNSLNAFLPGATVAGLSLDVLFSNILTDAAQGGPRYGLTNTTVPCLTPANPPISCTNAVFSDALHPSSAAHQLIADAAYTRIVSGRDVSVVPEPSTMALMIGGLAMLGVVARRKRA